MLTLFVKVGGRLFLSLVLGAWRGLPGVQVGLIYRRMCSDNDLLMTVVNRTAMPDALAWFGLANPH